MTGNKNLSVKYFFKCLPLVQEYQVYLKKNYVMCVYDKSLNQFMNKVNKDCDEFA
jgi:hypothetical protein